MQHFSLLDLSPVPEGKTTADALANSVALAHAAENAGYHRYWLAEHHNMAGIASAATALVIGHVAAATRTMRIHPQQAPLSRSDLVLEPNLTNAALRLNVCIFFHGPQFLDQALASSPNSS
jgi:hypothetical protein